MDKPELLKAIKSLFVVSASSNLSFRECIAEVLPLLNEWAEGLNAENWQMHFDTLYWYWTEDPKRNSIHPQELDKMSIEFSPFCQKRVIAQQIRSADEWAVSLNAMGISPSEALGLAKAECTFIVEKAECNKLIATASSPIAIPQRIVELYRVFYRASKQYQIEVNDALRPLHLAKDVISKSRSNGEDLIQEITGTIAAKLRQIHTGNAKGRWVLNREDEISAIYEFAEFMVVSVLGDKFKNDKSAFSSKTGIGLIENACYYIYVLAQEKERNVN